MDKVSLIQSAVVAASVSAVVSIMTLWVNVRRDRFERQRQLFGQGFWACQEYKEFSFRVRRREATEPQSERRRLSGELSDVQTKLDYYDAILRIEAPSVWFAFHDLVGATRRIAGEEISRAWGSPPVSSDDAMRIRDIDLSELDGYENAFQASVKRHLSLFAVVLEMRSRKRRL